LHVEQKDNSHFFEIEHVKTLPVRQYLIENSGISSSERHLDNIAILFPGGYTDCHQHVPFAFD
jgi:hypothetical protein